MGMREGDGESEHRPERRRKWESEEESHWKEGEHDSAMDSTSDSAVS